ncbi:HAMP domain-containing histidine kinase [Oscillospiraceae bacterium CM]|nr:HAMP domain-containing histidine kinase [Oscillospiraceae bacterium CM]
MRRFEKGKAGSLRVRIWGYFIVFTAVIMTALWLLQIVFLNSFYTQTKLKELQKAAEDIASADAAGELAVALGGQYFAAGISVRFFDENGMMKYTMNKPAEIPLRDELSVTDFVTRLKNSTDGKQSYIENLPHGNGKLLYYGIILPGQSGAGKYLVVSAQINLDDSPAALLQVQLFIVLAAALALSAVISLLIASRLSRPISNLTKSAEQLAGGDYGVTFEGGSYAEINQLAGALNYATKELSKTNTLQRELIANVSHDLRTPLTMVKMYAELIRDVSGDKPEKRHAHTEVIIEEADRLSALISDILDLSKIQSGAETTVRTTFDLCDKVSVILNRFKALSERDGYVFDCNCTDSCAVCADERQIEQAVYNLIGNAVNYSGDDKKITIRVSTHGGKARFEVQDTGPGIPEAERQHIWERYYRGDKTHKRGIAGTGLGLSIVKGILTAHNAAFGVISDVGSGSTFWFELDAVEPEN